MQPALGGRAMYRLGAYIGDEALCDLGVFLARTRPEPDDSDALLHYAADIFNREAIDSEPLRPPFRRQGYFSAAQLMVAVRA